MAGTASEAVVVLCTTSSAGEASDLIQALLESRLAACVSTFPVESSYRWEGKIENSPEHMLVLKSTRAKVAALTQKIRELHSYDVPEVLVLPVISGLDEYLIWIAKETGGDEA